MDLSGYLGKKVRIELLNGFYYKGTVLDVDKEGVLTLKDMNGDHVTLRPQVIMMIRVDEYNG